MARLSQIGCAFGKELNLVNYIGFTASSKVTIKLFI